MSSPLRSRGRFVLPALVALLALAPAGAPATAAAKAKAKAAKAPALVQPASCSATPLTRAQRTRDTDDDRRANWRDGDVDGDHRVNGRDGDVDGDHQSNGKDADVDGDGLRNGVDRDVDGDGRANASDPDVDGDGIPNAKDPDIDGDGIPNAKDPDIDGDCTVNGRDADSDGDGIPDTQDAAAFGDGAGQAARAASTTDRVPAAFFGLVANEAMGRTGAAQDAVLSEIRAAGAGTLRQKLDWASVERAPGQYTWTSFDQLMLGAARAGLHVLPILFNPPAFASADPQADGTAPPRDNADFAAFAAAAVRRYGPGGALWAAHPEVAPVPVASWQVWNEPNFKAYWPSGPDPAAYAAMLRAVGDAIHGADPAAEVVAAGLPESYSGISVVAYVEGLYAAGAKGAFDTLAVHPYARSAEQALAILEGARAVLDRHGDAAVPIWATELGWATDGPAAPYVVDAADQAALVTRTLTALVAQRAQLRLRGVVYYDWQDCGPYSGGTDFWGLHTGLHGVDGAPKPALAAFTATTQALTAPAA
jgi:hypothetical protein